MNKSSNNQRFLRSTTTNQSSPSDTKTKKLLSPSSKTPQLTRAGHLVITNVNNNQSKRLNLLALHARDVSPEMKLWRRYTASGPVNGKLSIFDCLNAFLFCTSATNLSPLVECIRIKKIMWLAPLTTQGTTVVLTITPTGVDTANNSFTTRSESFTDSSASIDHPAFISIIPARDTPAGSWHESTAVNKDLFEISCPTGTVMDIQFDVVFSFNGLQQGYFQSSALAVFSNFYCKNILTTFVPAGVNSVV